MQIKNQIMFLTDVDYVRNDWIGGFSPLEQKIIHKYTKPPILHLFSGNSLIGDIRIDINPNSKCTEIKDVFEYIKDCNESFNTILLDPIYSSANRVKFWREVYNEHNPKLYKKIYVFPYDTRRTKKLWDFFEKKYPLKIIIKSLGFYTIPNYKLLQGFCLYPGAFKPNRSLAIYQSKNHKLEE